MVTISLCIAAGKEGIQSYTSEKFCWMSSANNLIWPFVTFVITIEVINLVILARVIKEMTGMQPTGEKQGQQIRIGIRACVVMIPLLGVTWLFGLLSPLHITFSYIFTILNSTQIRERFKRKLNTVSPSTITETPQRRPHRFIQVILEICGLLNCSLAMNLSSVKNPQLEVIDSTDRVQKSIVLLFNTIILGTVVNIKPLFISIYQENLGSFYCTVS